MNKENKKRKFILIAGPCVIEDYRVVNLIAQKLKEITDKYEIDFIFKASFDKANRTSLNSFRGPGLDKGLEILREVKANLGVKVLSDIHSPQDVAKVKDVLDVIQIPAFLSRQTDLVVAAANSGKMINIKKAQFMAPHDLEFVIDKIKAKGNHKIMLTERGTCFGYNNLVVDFRSIPIMKKMGFPVIYDVTHSLQRPSAAGGVSGGDREFVLPLARAGVACGVDGLFVEVHPQPAQAKSDSATSYYLDKIEDLIDRVSKIREVINDTD